MILQKCQHMIGFFKEELSVSVPAHGALTGLNIPYTLSAMGLESTGRWLYFLRGEVCGERGETMQVHAASENLVRCNAEL